MRLIKYLILAAILIALVVVALANREPMTLQLLPAVVSELLPPEAQLGQQLTLPIFIVILGTFLLGLFFGFIWERLREHKHRATAKVERRERERLEKEVHKASPPADRGDDVLAILEGR